MEATQHLLGDTIRLSDQEWQSPSLLPGWTRAHVATHLARNADGLTRSVRGVLDGAPTPMYDSEENRQRDIERGSERPGLELQIDLDTSAGNLSRTFLELLQAPPDLLEVPVELRPNFTVPAGLLPLARLWEVVMHRIDLGLGYTVEDIEPDIARYLLEWVAMRLSMRTDIPRLHITSTSGYDVVTGSFGELAEVTGEDRHLVGWLTGRSDAGLLQGNGTTVLPLIG